MVVLEAAAVVLGVRGLRVNDSCVLLLIVYTKFRTPSGLGMFNVIQGQIELIVM